MENNEPINEFKNKKALVRILELFSLAAAFGFFLYLAILPAWPPIWFYFHEQVWQRENETKENVLNEAKKEVEKAAGEAKAALPIAQNYKNVNRIIIPKIGVNSPIIASDSSEYGLDRGAWLDNRGSTPDQDGNTVITGHRFKYLPPSNLTFYLLDRLSGGDAIAVIWKGEEYYYRVESLKRVNPDDVSLYGEEGPVLTLYTCDPVFSQEKRLVVIARPAEGR